MRNGCPWADCWCRLWPPLRLVHSTGDLYTVDEVKPGLFRYRYITPDQQESSNA